MILQTYSFGDYSASINSKENWFCDAMVISVHNNRETKSQALYVIYVLLYPKLNKIDQFDMCETSFELNSLPPVHKKQVKLLACFPIEPRVR